MNGNMIDDSHIFLSNLSTIKIKRLSSQ